MGKWIFQMLQLLPVIVTGIEHIHGDAKTGAEKKQLAMESLGLASGLAGAVDPSQQAIIDASTQLASTAIDGVVAVMNAAKVKTPAPPAAVVPADPGVQAS